MLDIESSVFDIVATAFSSKYPNGSRYGEIPQTPASFPCLTLVEADNAVYEDSITAGNVENHSQLMYEVNVFSNKEIGAKQEAKDIMHLVDKTLSSLGFIRQFCEQTRNAENRIYRMTARYRGVVGRDNIIYK